MNKVYLVVFSALCLTSQCLGKDDGNGTASNTKLKKDFDGKGLEPWYNLAKSFIHTVQKKDPPYEQVDGFDAVKFLKGWELPILVTTGIGVLLAVLLPIIGFCFCCCRCCGNCGGEMSQKQSSNARMKRAIFGIILAIITLLMFVGCLMAFVSNDRITDSVENFKKTPVTALSEVDGYFNDTLSTITSRVFGEVLGLLDKIVNEVRNLPVEISNNVRKELAETVEKPLKSIVGLGQATNTMKELLADIDRKSTWLKNKTAELENNITEINEDITNNCPAPGTCQNVSLGADFNNLPDISSELTKVSSVVSQNITGEAQKGLDEFNKIDVTIKDKTTDATNSIKNETDKAKNTFTNEIEKDIVDRINSNVFENTEKYRSDIEKYFDDYIHPNDKYRYYAGVGLTCLVLIPVLLMALGLLFGICGHDKDCEPTERGCMSHTGGNFLMAAVGFMFIFVFFLMLFTALCFLLGANYEKACDAVRNDAIFTDYLDNPQYWDGDYYIAKQILKNGSIPLTGAGILESCRVNAPIFQAIQGYKRWNLKEKFDVEKELGDIEKNLNDFNVSIDDQKILNDETLKNLEDLGNTGVDGIDFEAFFNETGKEIVPNISATITALENLPGQTDAVNKLKIVQQEAILMKQTSHELEDDVRELERLGGNLSVLANDTIKTSKTAESNFKKFSNEFLGEQVKEYTNRTMGWIKEISDRSIDLIENELGRCKIVTDIYDAVVNLLCREAVYPFNGFWFAIGFSLFFYIPAIIFSVKLAKHYRRMQFEEGFDRHTGFEMGNVGSKNAVYPN